MNTTTTPTNPRFTDRVVLITGAAQGLGLAMAQHFAHEGAKVELADLQRDQVEAAADAINSDGALPGRANATTVDVARAGDVDRWINGSAAQNGSIDVLINNAGVIRDNRIENIDDDDWRMVVDVSLSGAFYCCRAALPHMKKQQRGRIISFSSMSWRGNFGQANYVAAKAGVVGLTRAIALEGARHGITANAIAPGLIETPMLASMNGPARKLLIDKVPLRETGNPSDIAEAAMFLASEQARYITGIVLDVDGGISIGSSIR